MTSFSFRGILNGMISLEDFFAHGVSLLLVEVSFEDSFLFLLVVGEGFLWNTTARSTVPSSGTNAFVLFPPLRFLRLLSLPLKVALLER